MPDAVPAPSPLSNVPAQRVWFTVGPVAVTTGRLVIGVIILLAIATLAITWHRIDIERVHALANELPGWGAFALICVVPLAGVPAAMLHIVSGLRFGTLAGLAVVALATVVHHVIGYSLVRLAPRVFARRLAGWRQRFPRGAHRPMTVFSCLLPGMPYAVQLYLLPVLGVPLRVLLTVSAPLHVLRATVTIAAAAWSNEFTPAKIAALSAYYILLTFICTIMLRRIRVELKRPAA